MKQHPTLPATIKARCDEVQRLRGLCNELRQQWQRVRDEASHVAVRNLTALQSGCRDAKNHEDKRNEYTGANHEAYVLGVNKMRAWIR